MERVAAVVNGARQHACCRASLLRRLAPKDDGANDFIVNLRRVLEQWLDLLLIIARLSALPPPSPHAAPASGYASPQVGSPWKADRFSGQDFALQPDGTLRCPADQKLLPHEQRREADGSRRVVYGASIRSCRPCPLREQCQWNGAVTAKPRQVSVLLHPLPVGTAPLLWRDWSRRAPRRACMQLVRHQRLEMSLSPPTASPPITDVLLSRA